MLAWYALKLGSDCPFFIYNKPLMAGGRGEVFESIVIDLSGRFIILVNPGFAISTQEAYRNLRPAIPQISIREILEKKPAEEWKNNLSNDFEKFTLQKYPVLGDIKHQLYNTGALYTSMTGSGSGVYGIFENPPQILPEFPDEYIIWSGVL